MISLEGEEGPWERFFVLYNEPIYKLKRIRVDPGERLSYQYHHIRSKTLTIVERIGVITLNGLDKKYTKRDTVHHPQGMNHRIENKADKKVAFIEVQTSSYFGEDDIVRIEEYFNRV